MRFIRFVAAVLESPASWPLLTTWLIGGASFASMSAGYIDAIQTFTIMTASLILLMLIAFRKDLAEVHDLVNSTNDRMVNRITQLTTAIENSGNVVPAEPHLPKES